MASIKDVARVAGVGIGTVSRVLNNSGPVKETTRQRILQVIEEFDYTPNEVARSFKRQSTKLIGLMIPTLKNSYFSELTYYVEDELYRNGYKMLLCNSSTNREKEIDYLNMLKMNQVDGIITISYHEYYEKTKVNLPLVTIDRYVSENIPHLSADNYKGGKIAVEKLIEAGCKKLAYLGGEPPIKSSVSNRKIGFIETAKQHNIPYVIYEVSAMNRQDILNKDGTISELEIARDFVDQYKDIDGVLTSSDLFAGAYIAELKRVNKCVPKDVKVIGFDGIQNNEYFKSFLSTIVQPVEEIGRQSVKTILGVINKEDVPKDQLFDVYYREGDSCKKI